jgi:hypothetical protein
MIVNNDFNENYSLVIVDSKTGILLDENRNYANNKEGDIYSLKFNDLEGAIDFIEHYTRENTEFYIYDKEGQVIIQDYK